MSRMHENRLLQTEIQPDLLIDPAVHFHPNGIDKPEIVAFLSRSPFCRYGSVPC